MAVRQAAPSDLDKILPLFHEYRTFYRQGKNDLAREFLQERLTKKESVIFVFEENEVICGFTQLYPSFTSKNLGRTWILNDLYVTPSMRRKKIAWKLMDAACAFAKETNAKFVSLSTEISNTNAQELYKKYGFKKDNDFFHFNFSF